MKIANLTQHVASKEQENAGVFDLTDGDRRELSQLLNFEDIPSTEEVQSRATAIAAIATSHGADAAMIGGALWLMAPLSEALMKSGIKPLFAFSRRETVEKTEPDGSVVKTAVFRHIGFYEVN